MIPLALLSLPHDPLIRTPGGALGKPHSFCSVCVAVHQPTVSREQRTPSSANGLLQDQDRSDGAISCSGPELNRPSWDRIASLNQTRSACRGEDGWQGSKAATLVPVDQEQGVSSRLAVE